MERFNQSTTSSSLKLANARVYLVPYSQGQLESQLYVEVVCVPMNLLDLVDSCILAYPLFLHRAEAPAGSLYSHKCVTMSRDVIRSTSPASSLVFPCDHDDPVAMELDALYYKTQTVVCTISLTPVIYDSGDLHIHSSGGANGQYLPYVTILYIH